MYYIHLFYTIKRQNNNEIDFPFTLIFDPKKKKIVK